MKHLILIVLFFSINYSYGKMEEKQIPLNGNPVILFVAKNDVSASISVHTYRLNGSISTEEISDTDGQLDYSNNVQLIVDTFLSVEGVSRCTFDKTTQTFTLLTSPVVDLLQVVLLINNN
mgnify:CR=1 FL=1